MALDYTITFAGLTVGNGTPYQIMGLEGIEDLPDLRSGDTVRAFADGEVPGLDLLAGRTITLELAVFDSGVGDFFANVERVKAMSVPATSESAFVYQLPGRNPRALLARARRRSLPVTDEYQFRKGKAVIEWHATDPRIYDQSFTSTVVGLPSAATGLTFNATAPFVFGSAGTGGSVLVTNSGNFPAPWVAVITGPVTNPSVTANGLGLTFNGTVNAGETLVVDSLARSVLLNGTASRNNWVAAASVWWALPPGNTTVQFNATSGTGTLTFSYRSAWV